MGGVKVGVAPDGTPAIVLEFDSPDEEDEWRQESRRKEGRKPIFEPDLELIQGGREDE